MLFSSLLEQNGKVLEDSRIYAGVVETVLRSIQNFRISLPPFVISGKPSTPFANINCEHDG